MKCEDVLDLIRNGEDSGLEFKRNHVTNYDLAKELVAFLNVAGGIVLLGVEDDRAISGTSRDRLDEWIAELCRCKIDPPIIPFLSWAREMGPGKHVLAVRVPVGPDKPYARVHDDRRTYFVRVGRTCREEAIVNALVHRDYSVAGTDITLAIFADRLEIQSPGGLPNTVTVEGMKAGLRYARTRTS